MRWCQLDYCLEIRTRVTVNFNRDDRYASCFYWRCICAFSPSILSFSSTLCLLEKANVQGARPQNPVTSSVHQERAVRAPWWNGDSGISNVRWAVNVGSFGGHPQPFFTNGDPSNAAQRFKKASPIASASASSGSRRTGQQNKPTTILTDTDRDRLPSSSCEYRNSTNNKRVREAFAGGC